MQKIEEAQLKRGRLLYIFFCAVEYLVALGVSGSFLAKLTTEIGMSDGMTGIISAVASLGGLFQLISMFVRKSRVKRFVIMLTAVNQLLFIALYLIPRLALGQQVSGIVFALTIVMAYLLLNTAAPKLNRWTMALVDERKRGIFGAYKEMFSLAMGMAFSFGMGALFDYLEGMGRLQTAFGLMAVAMTVCMLLSILCLVFIVEKPMPMAAAHKSLARTLKELIQNRRLRMVVGLYVLFYFMDSVSLPFFGTYQLNELGFSLTLISGFGILSSVVRMAVSPSLGKLADRTSSAAMLQKCFLLKAAAFLTVILASPANGKVMFALYYVFHGVASGGLNNGLFNIVFENVPFEESADALAICLSVSGLSGFLVTLLFSSVVTVVQQGGNQLFGLTVYAQQLLSVISLIAALGTAAFIQFCMKEKKKA